MYTWFSDLDNTLIYSHRTPFTQKKVLVEYLSGKEQSYMTKKTYDFMCGNYIQFVPVTTRSIAQYNRLFVFGKEIKVEYALVCNGAILLKDGIIDEEWLSETKAIAKEGIRILANIQNELSEYNINNIEGVMLYFKADKPMEIADLLRSKYVNERVYIGFDKRKVYVVPSEISKGNAVRRYSNRFGITDTVSSGDSEFDVSMLDVTNISMCPNSLMKRIKSADKKYVMGDNLIFSDAICEKLKIIIEENRQ